MFFLLYIKDEWGYWFNLWSNGDVILNRAKDYYENDKERLKRQARDEYRNLSEEEKNKKRENGKNIYRNMSEEKKQRLKNIKKIIKKIIARQKSLNAINKIILTVF